MQRLAAIGLGSSLGPRRLMVERAVRALHRRANIEVLAVSSWYRTPPLRGSSARGWFINGVAVIATHLQPHTLLDELIRLEELAGRRRGLFWGDRTLDLDLLGVAGCSCDDERLRLPHPRIQERPFVFVPLAEVWPSSGLLTGSEHEQTGLGPRPYRMGRMKFQGKLHRS